MRHSFRTFITPLIVFLTATLTNAQESLQFSLQEAQQYALENSFKAKNAQLDASINKKRALEIITEGLPKMDVGIVYKNNFELPVSIVLPNSELNPTGELLEIEFGTQHNLNADFLLTQLIVDGRYFIGLKANKTLVAMSREQINMTEADLINEVAKAYYAALVARENTTLIDSNMLTLRKLLYETKELYENGFADELSVDRLDLSLSNLISQQKNTALQLKISQDVLKYQMGLSLDQSIELTDKLDRLIAEVQEEPDAIFDYANRPEYKLLDLQSNMRGYDASRIAASYAPSLSAFFGYGYNAQRGTFNLFDFSQPWYNVGYVGIELKVPIFDSFKSASIYQQKKLEQQKLQNQRDEFAQQANLEVKRAEANYYNAIEEFANQKKNLALAKKIYNTVQLMYREGIGSSLELADAETSLTATQSSYINSLYNLLVTKSELEKALGKY